MLPTKLQSVGVYSKVPNHSQQIKNNELNIRRSEKWTS